MFNHYSRERWVDGYKPYLTCLNTPSITPVRSSLEPKYARVRTRVRFPSTHRNARWVSWPTCNPSMRGRGRRSLVSGFNREAWLTCEVESNHGRHLTSTVDLYRHTCTHVYVCGHTHAHTQPFMDITYTYILYVYMYVCKSDSALQCFYFSNHVV